MKEEDAVTATTGLMYLEADKQEIQRPAFFIETAKADRLTTYFPIAKSCEK